MARPGLLYPADPSVVIDEIPDASTASDLVLPLRQRPTSVEVEGELPLELMVPACRRAEARMGLDGLESGPSVARHLPTQLFPPFGCIVSGKT